MYKITQVTLREITRVSWRLGVGILHHSLVLRFSPELFPESLLFRITSGEKLYQRKEK